MVIKLEVKPTFVVQLETLKHLLQTIRLSLLFQIENKHLILLRTSPNTEQPSKTKRTFPEDTEMPGQIPHYRDCR